MVHITRLRHWLSKRSLGASVGLGVLGVVVLLLTGGGVYALLGGFASGSSSSINLQQGLVGWWKFDGNVKDSSAYRATGVQAGTTAAADRKGASNKALSFSGSSASYAGVATFSHFPSTAVSSSMWVNGASGSGNQGIVSYSTAGANDWMLFGFNNLNFYVNNAQVATGVVIPSSGWHHVVTTWQSSNGALVVYLDGVQAYSGTIGAGASYTNNGCLVFGQDQDARCGGFDSAQALNGSLDDFRLYNRVLSPAEVSALYNEYDAQINVGNGQKGLVGWWGMEGSAKDSSPYRDNGTVTGATLTADRKGSSNSAYNFANSTDNISIPSNTALNNQVFTMSAWVKPTSTGAAETVIGNSAASGGPQFTVTQLGRLILNQQNNVAASSSAGTIPFNAWSHIAITFSGGTLKYYINGTLDSTVTFAQTFTYSNFLIGKKSTSDSSESFKGAIDDVRIYGRVLSQAELQQQFTSYNSQININSSPTNQPTANLSSGLLGYWPFNGNAHDISPYRSNGTVTGATLTPDRKGRASSAYLLGDTGAYINVGSPSAYSNLTTSGFTYSAWLMRTTTSTYNWPEIMGASNTHLYYGLRSQSFGNGISFEYGNGTFDGAHFTSAGFGSCGTPTYGTWHLYTVTYSGTTLLTYCDGGLVGTATAVLDPAFGGLSFNTSANGWNGSIDDARVWKRALTATEVGLLYGTYY